MAFPILEYGFASTLLVLMLVIVLVIEHTRYERRLSTREVSTTSWGEPAFVARVRTLSLHQCPMEYYQPLGVRVRTIRRHFFDYDYEHEHEHNRK